MREIRHAFFGDRDECETRLADSGTRCGLARRLHPVVVCSKCGVTPMALGKSPGGVFYAKYEGCCIVGGTHYTTRHREGAVVRADVFMRTEICGEWITAEDRGTLPREREGKTS